MIYLTILLGLAVTEHPSHHKDKVFSSIEDSCAAEFKSELAKCEELTGHAKISCQTKANSPYIKCINWMRRG